MNTMHVESKFVITNTPHLINPKGYNIKDRVFAQTTVAIHCNKVPKKLPRGTALYLHNIDELVAKSSC